MTRSPPRRISAFRFRLGLLIGFLVLAGVAAVTWRLVAEASRRRTPPAVEAAAARAGSAVPRLDVPTGAVGRSESDRGVAGLVLRPDGAPAVGARVTLLRALSPWPEWRRETIESTVTTIGGEFRFRTVRAPDLLVEFEHRDFAGDLMDAPPAVPVLRLRLQHGFTVSGHVLSDANLRLGGCRVILEPTLGDSRRALGVETGSDGTFRLDNVPAGSVRVVARHPWWQPAALPLVTVGASRGLELRFSQPALALEGRVLTAGQPQRPVSGARVRALPNVNYRDLFEPVETTTDAQGVFRLQGLGQGNLRLEVRHDEWSTASRSVAVSLSSAPVTFELLPRCRVRGTLRDAAAAIGGVTAGLVLRSAAGEQARCEVQADGSFAFPGTFSQGNATLEAVDGAFAFARTSGADVLVRIEEGAGNEIDLEVLPPSVVRGRVVDPEGRPLEAAQLLVSQEYLRLEAPDRLLAVTERDGTFRIRGLAVRPVTLSVRHDRYARVRVEVQVPAPSAEVTVPDIALPRGGGIEGRVLRGPDPLPGALVLATASGSSGAAVSQADGSFRIGDLPPGSYRVRARYSTMPLAFCDGLVEVAPDRDSAPVELRFAAGRTVNGVVVGRDSQPGEGAVVSVRGLAGSGAPIVTDAAGNFSIEVPPREVELLVASGDGNAQAVATVASASSELTVSLDVPPMATVTGRLLAAHGRRPMASALLRIVPRSGPDAGRPQSRWVELPGGVLRHPFVPAHPCRLLLQCEEYAPHVAELNLGSGQEHDLGEVLLEHGASLHGVAVDESGRPVAGCTVFLGDEADLRDHLPQGRTGADGRFALRGVSTASATLVAFAPGYAPRTVALRLPQDVLGGEPLRVELERGARIEISVSGGAAEGQRVVLLRGGAVVGVEEVDESGVAVFVNRGRGEYEAHLFGASDRRAAVRVERSGAVYRVAVTGR